MGLEDHIESAMKSILKNPILDVLRTIDIVRILRKSNFIKRDIGHTPFQILLHFVYMLMMDKRQSTFIRHSDDAYSKDTYYRFVKETRYNWRRLLLLSATALIVKVQSLHRYGEHRLLIIDDTVEPKRGKQIEGSCRSVWSDKEKRTINAMDIVSLDYADSHSTFQLDFAVAMNKSRRKEIKEFSSPLHHKTNAHRRRAEGLKGKNTLAIEMVERALDQGIDADYLLVESWHPEGTSFGRTLSLALSIRQESWVCR